MVNKKRWYTIKDGKIDHIQIMREGEMPKPENLDWIEAPPDAELHPETPVERYDENTHYLDDDEWCAKQGKINPKGKWYNKETKEQRLVLSIDDPVDEAVFTREEPIDDEAYQYFDETENCWVVDAEKKEAAEYEMEIAQKNAELEEEKKKMMYAFAAISQGIATEEDIQTNEESKAKIIELTQEVATLKQDRERRKIA